MEDKILSCGADIVKSIDVKDIVFDIDFRKFCEENKCGNYNKNYSCPPFCGTAQQLINKVKGYKTAYIFAVTEKINGYEDMHGIKRAEQRIAYLAERIDDCVCNCGVDYYIIGGGPCCKCSPCKMASNEPCLNPDKAFISLSAFCIDTQKLTEHCGIVQKWDGSEISYIGLLLVK